jgi:hypothetical protein
VVEVVVVVVVIVVVDALWYFGTQLRVGKL